MSDDLSRKQFRRWALAVDDVGLLGPLCWPLGVPWLTDPATASATITFATRREARAARWLLSSYRHEARVVSVVVTVEIENPTS